MSQLADTIILEPVSRTENPAAPTTDRPRVFRRHVHRWILLGITLAAALLRFYHLDQPPIWGDEAMTYHRVTGKYQHLLDRLQFDGFTPLHYELYWWIDKGMPIWPQTPSRPGGVRLLRYEKPPVQADAAAQAEYSRGMGTVLIPYGSVYLTPHVLRLVPALAGVLMVPAMYFLARQIAGRRAGLLAAALAAGSAFLLVFSRDAKMYMPCWLFATLHMGCLFWWLRARTRMAWLTWLATGMAAAGLHPTALVLLLVEPIILLSVRGLCWRCIPLLLIGAVIISAAPAGYYLGFNRWSQQTGGLVPGQVIEEDAKQSWMASGIDWIRDYQAGRTGGQLLLHTASAFLFSWEWPKESQIAEMEPSTGRPVIPPWTVAAGAAALAAILAVLALGALPWRRQEPAPRDSWRQLLWLAAWLVVPTYGLFYCRSVPDFSSPLEWAWSVRSLYGGQWTPMVLAIVGVGAGLSLWRPPVAVAAGVAAAAAGAMLLAMLLTEPAAPRGGDSLGLHLRGMDVVAVVPGTPAAKAGLKPGDQLLQVGNTLIRGYSDLVSAAAQANSGSSLRVHYRRDRQPMSATLAMPQSPPGSARYSKAAPPIRRLALHWISAVSIVLLVPLLWYCAAPTSAQRLRKLLQVASVAAVILLLCYGAYCYWDSVKQDFRDTTLRQDPNANWEALWARKWAPIWMPRYLGVLWPALAVTTAVLLLRLPGWPLRTAALVLILGVNLANAGQRILGPTEPPWDRVSGDIYDARQPGTATEIFCDMTRGGAHPADSGLMHPPARYYIAWRLGLRVPPHHFWHTGLLDTLSINTTTSPAAIQAQVASRPGVKRVVVWQRFGCSEFDYNRPLPPAPASDEDEILAALGSQWQRVDLSDHPIRQHWSWRDRGACRRREYHRVAQ
jgi:4-amino-4-deoxy-L-arabinose transferase-like glycosyltransferase